MIAKLFNGDPPVGDDFSMDPNSEDDFVRRGNERAEWALAWFRAQAKTPSRRTQGHRALIWSALHMPFTTTCQEAGRMFSDAIYSDKCTTRLLVMTAKDDPTCADVDVQQYETVFAQVEHTQHNEGRHCFHVQDAEKTNPQIVSFLQRRADAPLAPAAEQADASGEDGP